MFRRKIEQVLLAWKKNKDKMPIVVLQSGFEGHFLISCWAFEVSMSMEYWILSSDIPFLAIE